MEQDGAQLGNRSGFSQLVPRAYLNHAAISPPSDAVCQAVARCTHDCAQLGVAAFGPWAEQRERLRGKLATLVGASDPSSIGYVASTTIGLGALALSLDYCSGQRIVVFDGEYPSNVSPYQRVARMHDLELIFVSAADMGAPGGPDFTQLDAALAGGARLVAVSAVEFQNGLRMPLGEIARRAHAVGAEVIVDAVQACGATPVDVTDGDIDYLACGSHKWLMGPMGAGFVYIRPDHHGTFDPALLGSSSHLGALEMLFSGPGHLRYDRPLVPGPVALEGGMPNASGLAGLEAAVDPILALGVAAIHRHVNQYLDALEAGLVERGFVSHRQADAARRSCTLSLTPPTGPLPPPAQGPSGTIDAAAPRWVQALGARGVSVSCPDGLLRFSPHWPNGIDEVVGVLHAVDEIHSTVGR